MAPPTRDAAPRAKRPKLAPPSPARNDPVSASNTLKGVSESSPIAARQICNAVLPGREELIHMDVFKIIVRELLDPRQGNSFLTALDKFLFRATCHTVNDEAYIWDNKVFKYQMGIKCANLHRSKELAFKMHLGKNCWPNLCKCASGSANAMCGQEVLDLPYDQYDHADLDSIHSNLYKLGDGEGAPSVADLNYDSDVDDAMQRGLM